MDTYTKIEAIYARDLEGSKKIIDGVYRNEVIESLKNLKWLWTEKVDGTNIRVHWDGHRVEFGGRTDRAQIPAPLVNRLNELFGTAEAEELFEQMFGEKDVILFGEGYGAKIQKGGGKYLADRCDFILFDVMIEGRYQERKWVGVTANAFGIRTVPIVGTGTLDEAVAYVKAHPNSVVAESEREMEGLVCRPEFELQDRLGNRIIVKVKWEDLKELV